MTDRKLFIVLLVACVAIATVVTPGTAFAYPAMNGADAGADYYCEYEGGTSWVELYETETEGQYRVDFGCYDGYSAEFYFNCVPCEPPGPRP